jgi:hypothetical protein
MAMEEGLLTFGLPLSVPDGVSSLAKILTFQHSNQRVPGCQTNDVVTTKLAEPLAVVANFGSGGVEDFEDLR